MNEQDIAWLLDNRERITVVTAAYAEDFGYAVRLSASLSDGTRYTTQVIDSPNAALDFLRRPDFGGIQFAWFTPRLQTSGPLTKGDA